MNTIENKIDEYIETKESNSIISQINQTVWTKIEDPGAEKRLERYLKWKELYLKEKKSVMDQVNLGLLEIRFLLDKDFKAFKKELKDLEEEIVTTNEDLDTGNVDSNLETTETWKKIADFVADKNNLKKVKDILQRAWELHCRWFANWVYKKLWINDNDREVIYQDGSKYNFTDSAWTNKEYQLTWIWEQKTNSELIGTIQPWDWLYVHNKNKYDNGWNHSVIFIGRENGEVWKAITASYPGSHSEDAVLHTYDLNDNPIKHITRPQSA